ncbi:MAG: (4Fe-4S)-binding protein [Bacteroidota bacterium]|nr:(4Fe-4S)-binding protein [Bacteroidota bacterium]
MPKNTLKYTNGEITVVWKPDTCIHSRICWTELREVFDPLKRPWVNMEGSDTERIMEQIRKCPSGALSYFMNEAPENTGKNHEPVVTGETAEIMEIQIKPNGPILIKTDCHITLSDGTHTTKKGSTALCRCGGSGNKPYCDGTHNKIGFTG